MAFPLAFAGIPIYLHAPDFYASELNVPLAALGTSLLVLRIIDAVQDPLIGRFSDLYRARRKAIILFGACLLGLGFWMIFHPARSMTLVWFSASIFICTTGFSIVSINVQALGGIWHAGAHERTRITGWREGLGLIGLLAAAIVPSFLGRVEDAAAAFHTLSMIYIPVLAVATWLLFRWMRFAALDNTTGTALHGGWSSLLKSDWRRQFFGIYFVNGFASAIPAVLVIFFIRDRLQAEADTGIFLLLYFMSGALVMPVWLRISKSVGKYRCWGFSIILAVATFGWASLLGPGDREAFAIICMLSGIALGADMALPPSMLADHISHQDDQASASSHFSIMTLLSKAALALATGLILPLLGMLGYQPGNIADQEVTKYLSIFYALVPSALKLLVVFWLWRRLPLLQSLGERDIRRESAVCIPTST
jgi:Na+/melibiose symporter-like transporter